LNKYPVVINDNNGTIISKRKINCTVETNWRLLKIPGGWKLPD
jgi:hypothetical protein